MTRWLPVLIGLAVAAAGAFVGWKARDQGHRALRETIGDDQLAALRQRFDEWNRLSSAERQRISRLHAAVEAEPDRRNSRLQSAGWYAQLRDLMPEESRQRLDRAASVTERADLVAKAAAGEVRRRLTATTSSA